MFVLNYLEKNEKHRQMTKTTAKAIAQQQNSADAKKRMWLI